MLCYINEFLCIFFGEHIFTHGHIPPRTYFPDIFPEHILSEHSPAFLWAVGGALVESTPFVRRVMGSNPALAAT